MIAWEDAKGHEHVMVTDLLDRFAQGPPFADVVPDRRLDRMFVRPFATEEELRRSVISSLTEKLAQFLT